MNSSDDVHRLTESIYRVSLRVDLFQAVCSLCIIMEVSTDASYNLLSIGFACFAWGGGWKSRLAN